MGKFKMSALKTNIRLKVKEAEELQDRAWEMTLKNKKIKKVIQEPDIVHFLIERCTKLVDVDEKGEFFLHDVEDF